MSATASAFLSVFSLSLVQMSGQSKLGQRSPGVCSLPTFQLHFFFAMLHKFSSPNVPPSFCISHHSVIFLTVPFFSPLSLSLIFFLSCSLLLTLPFSQPPPLSPLKMSFCSCRSLTRNHCASLGRAVMDGYGGAGVGMRRGAISLLWRVGGVFTQAVIHLRDILWHTTMRAGVTLLFYLPAK